MTTLRYLRQRVSLSQQALAATLGLHQSSVSTWERGLQIPPDKSAMLLRFFDLVLGEDLPAGLLPEHLSQPWNAVKASLKFPNDVNW